MITNASIASHDPALETAYSPEIAGWILAEYAILTERNVLANYQADQYVTFKVLLIATNRALAEAKTKDEQAGASGASVSVNEQSNMWAEKRKSYQTLINDFETKLTVSVSHVHRKTITQFKRI